jgi:selenocysteine lyase/cysteine desulfurase
MDLPGLPVDVLACAGHKWLLGPVGTGFLYVRQGLLETLPPPFAGWVSRLEGERFAGLTDYDRPLPPDATRYEVGSPPDILLETLEASLDLLLETGVPAVEERLRSLNARFAEAVPEGWEIVSPWGRDSPHASGILSLRKEGTDPMAGARALYKAGAFAVAREGLLRISPHVYIREEEMVRAAEALAGL